MVFKQQVERFRRSAQMLYEEDDYTSATILYFKALFALHDALLLEEMGASPKDHTQRFRSLEKHFPRLYMELDKEFTTYRDTYSKTVDRQTCERIRRMVEDAIHRHNIA